MRALTLSCLILGAVGALTACDPRGGRRVVLMPDEIAGRHDDQWRVTQEPGGAPVVGREGADRPGATP